MESPVIIPTPTSQAKAQKWGGRAGSPGETGRVVSLEQLAVEANQWALNTRRRSLKLSLEAWESSMVHAEENSGMALTGKEAFIRMEEGSRR